jgi:hypothetical protein
VIPTIATLVQKYGLQVPQYALDDASSELAYATQLRALSGAIAALQQRVKDEILRSEGAVWKNAVVSYGMLQKAAPRVAGLSAELAAVEQWFRKGHVHSKKSAGAPAAPAAPAAASANPVQKA